MKKIKEFGLNIILILCFILPYQVMSMSRPSSKQKTEESTSKQKTEESKSKSVLEKIWLPPDLSEEEKAEWKNGEPPGWSRGKKTGWRGGDMPPGLAKKGEKEKKKYPPGWENWKKEQQEKWKKQVEKIKEKISKDKGKDTAETEIMTYSVEEAARTGVPPEKLEEVTEKFLQKRLTVEEYEKVTRAMSYGVRKNVDFEQLGKFINSNIDSGVRGNDLAVKIYKEIVESANKK